MLNPRPLKLLVPILAVFTCHCRTKETMAGDAVFLYSNRTAVINRFTNADNGCDYSVAGFSRNCRLVEEFASYFRKAVVSGKRENVARMIRYPIAVASDACKLQINDNNDLLLHYEDIFTPELVRRIAAAATTRMFSNYQGVMLGDRGEIWIGPASRSVLFSDDDQGIPLVIAINVVSPENPIPRLVVPENPIPAEGRRPIRLRREPMSREAAP